ncbi:unnamed protein product, partial [Ilex paraguariensis]
SYYTTVTMENQQVDGDVSVDKGKRVLSESDASDSEYEPDCESSECSEYDTLVDSDYESENDNMSYDSYVDNEAEWTGLNSNRQKESATDKRQQLELNDTDEGNQSEVSQSAVSQDEGSQAAIIQAGMSQPAVSQSDVSQGGGSQAVFIQARVSQPAMSQSDVSQGGGSQAAVIQAGVSQSAVSQSTVSQGGGSQAAMKGRSCFE